MEKSKFNVGQYALKPWAANLIMGFLEFVLVLVWILGVLAAYFATLGTILNVDIDGAVQLMENCDVILTVSLCTCFLVWNLLVWFVKQLRTKFNFNESLFNIIFIVWLIVDTFILT